MTMDISTLQNHLNHLIDYHFTEKNINDELKENLNLSQFGLTEPQQVERFLSNTPQGKAIVTLVAQEEALEENLLEQQIERNIEAQQQEDELKKFILFETAMAIKASTEHAIALNHDVENSLSKLYESSKSMHTPAANLEINETLLSYNQTVEQLKKNHQEHDHLMHQYQQQTSKNSEIDALLTHYQLKEDIVKLRQLLLQVDSEEIIIKRNILKIKLNKKRTQLIAAMSNKASHAHLAIDELMLECLLLLSPLDQLNTLQVKIKACTDKDDFDACFSTLQSLTLITEHQLATYQTTLHPLLSHNESPTDPLAFIQLEKFKKTLMTTFSSRSLLDLKGRALGQSTDIEKAFYSKPNHLTTFFNNNVLYFIDINSFNDTILAYKHDNFLTTSNMHLEEEKGQLYLLRPNQTLNQMSHEEKIKASKNALKAKQNAFDAQSLAEKYALKTLQFQRGLSDIENKLQHNEETQNALKLTLKSKRQKIEACQKEQKKSLISPPTLAPNAPNLIPQKKIDLQLDRKNIIEKLEKAIKNKQCFTNQEMQQLNQQLSTHLQLLPPETQSLVLTKYRGILPVVSHLEHSPKAAIKPNTYDLLDLAKQQIELQKMMRYINTSLDKQMLYQPAPQSVPTPNLLQSNTITPAPQPMAG